jgi:competence protein ComEC
VTGIRTWILQQLEAEPGRWMLWLPVALGLGIAIYFELPSEPAIWLGPALTPAAACGAFLAPGGSRARALCVHWPRGGGCVIQRPPEGMRVVLEAARLKGNGAPVPK